jgi:hypothetical protein
VTIAIRSIQHKLQVLAATRLSLQKFAAMFSVGYRKIIEAQSM